MKIFTPYARVGRTTMTLTTLAIVALFVGLWSLAPQSPITPSPLGVWQQLGFQLNERGLLFELMVSARTNFEALFIATALSLALSYSYVFPFMRPIVHFFAGLRPLGIAGFFTIFLILIRDAHWVKVATVVFGILPYLTTALLEIVRTVEDDEFQHVRTLGLGHWGTTWQAIIRGRADHAIEAVRQSATIGWMMVAMVEALLRGEGGIGVMLAVEGRQLHMNDVFAITLVIYSFGLAQDAAFRFLRSTFFPYANLNTRTM